MNAIRRIISAVLTAIMLFSLVSCAGKQDDSPLTVYVGLGNSGTGYYEAIRDALYEKTGIEIELVFSSLLDTTSAIEDCIKNNDLPADITVTAMAAPAEYQKQAFLDLASHTDITGLFTMAKIRECSVDGAVYQLPFTSRLIGVEYNKTLFEEMGWSLPETYADMLALKEEAEKAGYPIAVSGGVATGHGFNYLFHTMGTQYLCSPDGSEWFNEFLKGEAAVDEFRSASEYFKKYADSGLFGIIHDEDWSASKEFSEVRALFYYNIINNVNSYDGFRYNTDGTLYFENGNDTVTPDENGNAVMVDSRYVLYDSADESMAELERYSIPGAVELHDTYASMPWISENGSSNCFTAYDNMFLGLSKSLGEKRNAQKLEKAKKVLEFMTTKDATDIFSAMYLDGYVATNDYIIDDSRIYSEYSDKIKSGYLIPWYYMSFDNDTIVNVGGLVNGYLLGDEVTFDSIFDVLGTEVEKTLSGTKDVIANIGETLGYADSAVIQAIAAAMSLQEKLGEAGIGGEVNVSLMPYTDSLSELPSSISVGVVQQKFYAGELERTMIRSHVAPKTGEPCAIKLTGAEIRSLLAEGYVFTAEDGTEYTFSYACAVRGGGEIDDAKEYLVSVPVGSITAEKLDAFTAAGKVIGDVRGSTEEGMALFAENNPTINKASLEWK